MKRLVADTGPILHLHEAGALHLLPLIGKTVITPVVRAELRIHAPSLWSDRLPEWVMLQSLSPSAAKRAEEWQRADLLHGGEAGALAVAGEFKPDWFLTDDAGARLMAESLGIETRGSIGVVLWAAAAGLIQLPEAERLLAGLEQSSLWLSARVRMEARRALVKLFGVT